MVLMRIYQKLETYRILKYMQGIQIFQNTWVKTQLIWDLELKLKLHAITNSN